MQKKKFKIFGIVILTILFSTLLNFQLNAVQNDSGTELTQAIQKEPISLFTYAAYTWDFLAEVAKRFAESAKPLVIFNNSARMGGEITWYEEPLFSLTAGKYLKENREDPNAIEFEDGWFFGIEAKFPEWPQGTDIGKMFSKLRPQILFHQGNWFFGLSYAFRSSVE